MNSETKPLAALTGGTGFVGRFILSELTRAGWAIRMLVRSEPMHPEVPDLDAEIVLGDLSDQGALERLCAGADAVIHTAGLIKARTAAQFFAVNEDGSANLARAAAKSAPKAPVIVLSSMAARAPHLSDYAASKRAGEEAVTKISAAPVTILRPSAVYGRWDIETFPLFQMAANGRIFAPGTPDARICLIHAADVARAVAAFANDSQSDGIFELTDQNTAGYSWADIAEAAGKAVGTTPRLTSVPPIVLRAAGHVVAIGGRIIGQTPILTPGKVREMLHVDWSSAPEVQPPASIWHPETTLEAGFQDTAAWYKTRKWL